jgi:hypothetical protein
VFALHTGATSSSASASFFLIPVKSEKLLRSQKKCHRDMQDIKTTTPAFESVDSNYRYIAVLLSPSRALSEKLLRWLRVADSLTAYCCVRLVW